MAVPAGYTVALTINTLGVVGNLLGVNTTLYQCPTCRATTLDPNSHDAWHASNVAAIADAKKAGTDAATSAAAAATAANAAKTTASTAASDAAAAKTTAGNAASAASAASTTASQAASDASKATAGAAQAVSMAQQADQQADNAYAIAQLALPNADVTLCPLCKASVNTNDLRAHLTFHYRRSHGDPVDFPADFDPTTQDMAEVQPPMRVANSG